MINLSNVLIAEKNKLSASEPWLVLCHIALSNGVDVRLVNNNEDVLYNGDTYVAFPFQLDVIKFDNTGEIPRFNLTVSNVTKIIQGYVEELNGALGDTVKLIVIHHGNLTEDYSALTLTYSILSVKCTAEALVINLGVPNPVRQKFPPYRYIAKSCKWQFNYPAGKSPECGYSGGYTTCGRTLPDCEERSNQARFGGYPALNPKGVRLV